MNVMPSLTSCGIWDHVYSNQREKQTEKERKENQKTSLGLLLSAAQVAKVCLGPQRGV